MTQKFLAADSTQIVDFMKCPQYWYYRWIKQIEPIGYSKKSLDTGSMMHTLLDYYYKTKVNPKYAGMHPIQIASICMRKFRAETNKFNLDQADQQFILERFLSYAAFYASNNDWNALTINGEPQVELGFSVPILDTSEFYFVIEGRIDMITSNKIFVDHKTQSRKYNHYKFSPQFLTYSLASGITQGCINYISVAKIQNEDTFRRMPFSISSEQRERWKNRVITIFKQMLNCVESGFYETREVSCQDQYGICEYAPIDELTDPIIQNKLIQLQYQKAEKWEPWSLAEVQLNANC